MGSLGFGGATGSERRGGMSRFLWSILALVALCPVVHGAAEDWHKAAVIAIVAALLAIAYRPDAPASKETSKETLILKEGNGFDV